jgi:hypothetical protein
MILHVVILRETEDFGSVKVSKCFKTDEAAQKYSLKLASEYTSDEEQLTFISDKIGDPVEFIGNDGNYWQIEVCQTELVSEE